jgi:hypothetical protein
MLYLPMHFFATVQFNVMTLSMSTKQYYIRIFETQSGTAFRFANNCAFHFLPIARALFKRVNNRYHNGSLFVSDNRDHDFLVHYPSQSVPFHFCPRGTFRTKQNHQQMIETNRGTSFANLACYSAKLTSTITRVTHLPTIEQKASK